MTKISRYDPLNEEAINWYQVERSMERVLRLPFFRLTFDMRQ